MKKPVLFIHGAGDGAFEEDELLAASLQNALGLAYAEVAEDIRRAEIISKG